MMRIAIRRARCRPITGLGGLCVALALLGGLLWANAAGAAASSVDAFVIPVGTAEGQIAYVSDGTDPWGPISFCVLPDKSVAIIDAGNQRIQVFDSAGSFLYSVNLAGIVVSPVDIRWWRGAFAILEASSDPNSVVLMTAKGTVKQRIDLPPNLATQSWGGLRIGSKGELELLEAGTWLHVLMSGNGLAVDSSVMAERQNIIAFQNGPEFALSQDESGSRHLKQAGSSPAVTLKPKGQSGGVTPLASDASGSSYFIVDSLYQLSPDQPAAVDRVVTKLDSDLQQVGLARLDISGSVVVSTRMLDLADDGTLYSMVGKTDGVHVEELAFSRTAPEFVQSTRVTSTLETAAATDSATPMVGTPGWTRSLGSWLVGQYYNMNWYCSADAYNRSNGNLNQNQAADNIRPRFLTSYNRYWQWTPYCWGGWDTVGFFWGHVNETSPGRDAGDIGSGYSNCAMDDYGNTTNYPCCGVDCSGFVGRCWGLTDQKRNVTMLEGLSTQISFASLIMGDAIAHPGHIMWFNSFQGQGYNIYESTTWNSYDSVRNTYHDTAYMSGRSAYRYNYWAQ